MYHVAPVGHSAGFRFLIDTAHICIGTGMRTRIHKWMLLHPSLGRIALASVRGSECSLWSPNSRQVFGQPCFISVENGKSHPTKSRHPHLLTTLLFGRCSSSCLDPCPSQHLITTKKRQPTKSCIYTPSEYFRPVELPSLGQHALPPATDRSARVLPHIWVRPLPPRAASRLSGLVRRLRCSSLNSVLACVGRLRSGPGPRSKCPYHQSPITNHQSPITRCGIWSTKRALDRAQPHGQGQRSLELSCARDLAQRAATHARHLAPRYASPPSKAPFVQPGKPAAREKRVETFRARWWLDSHRPFTELSSTPLNASLTTFVVEDWPIRAWLSNFVHRKACMF
jgi:hypothetical protein